MMGVKLFDPIRMFRYFVRNRDFIFYRNTPSFCIIKHLFEEIIGRNEHFFLIFLVFCRNLFIFAEKVQENNYSKCCSQIN